MSLEPALDELSVTVALEAPTIEVEAVNAVAILKLEAWPQMVGPAGPPGPAGPVGPAGEQGLPGGTLLSGWWDYRLPTTPPPPAGQILTAPSPLVVGQPMTIYLSATDRDGLIWTGGNMKTGDGIQLRGTTGALITGTITSFAITGSGATAYATIVATLDTGSGTINKQADVEVMLIRAPTPGPPGPQGDPGQQGSPGSIWYVSGQGGITDPVNITTPHVGDMFLYPSTGNIFRYSGANWVACGSIMGPPGP